MFKKHKKLILFIIVLIIVFISCSNYDYNRIKADKKPLFAIRVYKEYSPTETWWGLGYKIEREFREDPTETFSHSKKVKFYSLFINRDVTVEKEDVNEVAYSGMKVQFKDSCTDDVSLYYNTDDTYYYGKCIDRDIYVVLNNKTTTLKQVIKDQELSIDTILVNANKILENNNIITYSFDNFDILRCNSEEEKEIVTNMYILPKDSEDTFCKKSDNIKFTRTFKIVDKLEKSDDKNHIIVESFEDIPHTVEISNEIYDELEKDKTYEFIFSKNNDKIIDNKNVEEIFNYYDVIEVKETDKEGENQINEYI